MSQQDPRFVRASDPSRQVRPDPAFERQMAELAAARQQRDAEQADERQREADALRARRDAYEANVEREQAAATRARIQAEHDTLKAGFRDRYLQANPGTTVADFEASWPAMLEAYRQQQAMIDPAEQMTRELRAIRGGRRRQDAIPA